MRTSRSTASAAPTIATCSSFRRDFPDAVVVLLEQNYRSTQTILDVANSVIANNRNRTPKRLRTDNAAGLPVHVREAYNEVEEAGFVVDEIQKLIGSKAFAPGDFAITYRTNAQSRALEEAFVQRGIKYKLIGATRFYERKEIKDALAYLRLIHNPSDSVALGRIINEPPRSIGAKTVEGLRSWAADLGVSEYAALLIVHHGPARAAQLLGQKLPPAAATSPFSSRAQHALAGFAERLESWVADEQAGRYGSVADLLMQVLEQSGYMAALADGTTESQDRVENLQELRSVAAQYVQGMPDLEPGQTPLGRFLQEVALVSDADQIDEGAGAVTLLTLHTAKGLEFPVVFIVGAGGGRPAPQPQHRGRQLRRPGRGHGRRAPPLLCRCDARQTPPLPDPLYAAQPLGRERHADAQPLSGRDPHRPAQRHGGSAAAAHGRHPAHDELGRRQRRAAPAQRHRRLLDGAFQAAPLPSAPAGGQAAPSMVRRRRAAEGGSVLKPRSRDAAAAPAPAFKRRDSVQHASYGVGTVIESVATRAGRRGDCRLSRRGHQEVVGRVSQEIVGRGASCEGRGFDVKLAEPAGSRNGTFLA
jgi:hypothetical protein